MVLKCDPVGDQSLFMQRGGGGGEGGGGEGGKRSGIKAISDWLGGGGGLNFLCRSLEGGLWFEVHFKSGALPKVSVKHRVINLWLSVA